LGVQGAPWDGTTKEIAKLCLSLRWGGKLFAGDLSIWGGGGGLGDPFCGGKLVENEKDEARNNIVAAPRRCAEDKNEHRMRKKEKSVSRGWDAKKENRVPLRERASLEEISRVRGEETTARTGDGRGGANETSTGWNQKHLRVLRREKGGAINKIDNVRWMYWSKKGQGNNGVKETSSYCSGSRRKKKTRVRLRE